MSISRQLFSVFRLATMSDLLALTLRSICVGVSHKIVMSFFFLFLFIFNKENEGRGGCRVLPQVPRAL